MTKASHDFCRYNETQARKARKMRTIKRVLPIVLLLALALPALAHTDGGTDEAWTSQMNQESYWEGRFGAECTKYENHNGFIPSQYDYAVSKGGTKVRVYVDPPTWITGPHKDNGQHREISWVMKCKATTTTTSSTSTTLSTSTTVPESTTTSQPSTTTTEQVTTTTQAITTTTAEESSSTTSTAPSTTSTSQTPTTISESTTTTVGTSVTVPPVLPFTGGPSYGLLIGAGVLFALGLGLVRSEHG